MLLFRETLFEKVHEYEADDAGSWRSSEAVEGLRHFWSALVAISGWLGNMPFRGLATSHLQHRQPRVRYNPEKG
jgi:hypothetical protein